MLTINCHLNDRQANGFSQINLTEENWRPLKEPLVLSKGEKFEFDIQVHNLEKSAFAEKAYVFCDIGNIDESTASYLRFSNFGKNRLFFAEAGSYQVMFGIGCKNLDTEPYFATLFVEVK